MRPHLIDESRMGPFDRDDAMVPGDFAVRPMASGFGTFEPEEDPIERLEAELGFKKPDFQDEQLAPEVDWHLLLRLVRNEVSAETRETLNLLIVNFRSWYDAYLMTLTDEYNRRRSAGDSGTDVEAP